MCLCVLFSVTFVCLKLVPQITVSLPQAARTFRVNFCEVFQRMAEACRRGMGHNTDALFGVTDLLVALSQQASDDVRFAATLAAMEVRYSVALYLSIVILSFRRERPPPISYDYKYVLGVFLSWHFAADASLSSLSSSSVFGHCWRSWFLEYTKEYPSV